MRRCLVNPSLVMLFTVALASCGGDDSDKRCEGVTCSGHGDCVVEGGMERCVCAQGYQTSGHDCVPEGGPCAGKTCSGHGTCVAANGGASCNCEQGYQASGLDCVSSTAPCDGQTCSGHGTCVVSDGSASCNCEQGYEASGLACLAKSCSTGTGTVAHGADEQRTRYATASVAHGNTCVSEVQTRTCTNGTFSDWTGTYAFESCQVATGGTGLFRALTGAKLDASMQAQSATGVLGALYIGTPGTLTFVKADGLYDALTDAKFDSSIQVQNATGVRGALNVGSGPTRCFVKEDGLYNAFSNSKLDASMQAQNATGVLGALYIGTTPTLTFVKADGLYNALTNQKFDASIQVQNATGVRGAIVIGTTRSKGRQLDSGAERRGCARCARGGSEQGAVLREVELTAGPGPRLDAPGSGKRSS